MVSFRPISPVTHPSLPPMKHRTTKITQQVALLLLAVISGSSIVAGQRAASAGRSPNFIVILADDMGYADWGAYDHDGDPLTPDVSDTPNLDQMALDGVTLSDFYVSASVCSPVRSSLLTGRHQMRTRIRSVITPSNALDGMPNWERTVAEVLRDAGYRTAATGKWHLGPDIQYLPTRQGFDQFFGIPYSNNTSEFYLLERDGSQTS